MGSMRSFFFFFFFSIAAHRISHFHLGRGFLLPFGFWPSMGLGPESTRKMVLQMETNPIGFVCNLINNEQETP